MSGVRRRAFQHLENRSRKCVFSDVIYGISKVIFPLGLCVIAGIWFVVSFSDVFGYIINPEFYAVKDLLGIIFRDVK